MATQGEVQDHPQSEWEPSCHLMSGLRFLDSFRCRRPCQVLQNPVRTDGVGQSDKLFPILPLILEFILPQVGTDF